MTIDLEGHQLPIVEVGQGDIQPSTVVHIPGLDVGGRMPLWNVYCTEGTYSSEEKRAFAEAITDIYASDAGGLPEMTMPRFYVVVAFHDLPRDSLFVGGVPRNDFVRFSIDHIAYAMPVELRELLLKFINKSIHPFVRDRGLDWEIHIDHTPRDQWTIQGMRPPDSGSEEEKRWIRDNRPSKPTPSAAPAN